MVIAGSGRSDSRTVHTSRRNDHLLGHQMPPDALAWHAAWRSCSLASQDEIESQRMAQSSLNCTLWRIFRDGRSARVSPGQSSPLVLYERYNPLTAGSTTLNSTSLTGRSPRAEVFREPCTSRLICRSPLMQPKMVTSLTSAGLGGVKCVPMATHCSTHLMSLFYRKPGWPWSSLRRYISFPSKIESHRRAFRAQEGFPNTLTRFIF